MGTGSNDEPLGNNAKMVYTPPNETATPERVEEKPEEKVEEKVAEPTESPVVDAEMATEDNPAIETTTSKKKRRPKKKRSPPPPGETRAERKKRKKIEKIAKKAEKLKKRAQDRAAKRQANLVRYLTIHAREMDCILTISLTRPKLSQRSKKPAQLQQVLPLSL